MEDKKWDIYSIPDDTAVRCYGCLRAGIVKGIKIEWTANRVEISTPGFIASPKLCFSCRAAAGLQE